jgi:hypothetical protein
MVAMMVPKKGADGASSSTTSSILTLGRITETISLAMVHLPPVTWRKLLQISMSCRLVIVLAMALSCWLFPNHNPGDDFLRLPLRLEEESTSSSCSLDSISTNIRDIPFTHTVQYSMLDDFKKVKGYQVRIPLGMETSRHTFAVILLS